MRIKSAYNVNWRYESAPQDVDKCLMLTPAGVCIEAKPAIMDFGVHYFAWCEYPKTNKQEIERVKREYQGK